MSAACLKRRREDGYESDGGIDMTRIVLHIDRLQLRGIAREQRDVVVAALRAELSQAFAQPGVAEQWAVSGHRECVRLRLPQASEPAALGRDAARHIAHGAKP